VKTNLQAGRVRLIFVADQVPAELRRVVEFLNEQMDPAEVLAVEVRQFASGKLRTLVPRVFGQTSEALVKKSGSPRLKREWDEASFLAELKGGDEAREVVLRLLAWAGEKGLRIWWGHGAHAGSFFPMVNHQGADFWTISVWTYGRVEVQFQWLLTKPPFDSLAKRSELQDRLNAIEGISMPRDRIEKRPSIRLGVLARPEVLDRFLQVLDCLVAEIRSS
jgi:hypothetical protein